MIIIILLDIRTIVLYNKMRKRSALSIGMIAGEVDLMNDIRELHRDVVTYRASG